MIKRIVEWDQSFIVEKEPNADDTTGMSTRML